MYHMYVNINDKNSNREEKSNENDLAIKRALSTTTMGDLQCQKPRMALKPRKKRRENKSKVEDGTKDTLASNGP